jgi:hypothetical protein
LTEVVSNRRVSILAAAGALSILWAVFVVPADKPSTGLVWLGALVFLLVSSVVLLLGQAPPPALARNIRSLADERKR